MNDSCPECGSSDVDVAENHKFDVECCECGWVGFIEDLEESY